VWSHVGYPANNLISGFNICNKWEIVNLPFECEHKQTQVRWTPFTFKYWYSDVIYRNISMHSRSEWSGNLLFFQDWQTVTNDCAEIAYHSPHFPSLDYNRCRTCHGNTDSIARHCVRFTFWKELLVFTEMIKT